MTVHLIKLCVGVAVPEQLKAFQAHRIALAEAQTGRRFTWHTTRRMPKRAESLCDGGSLYWVIGGMIQIRQPIQDIRPVTDESGKAACLIEMAPEQIPVVPCRRKAFQGWRYLEPADAPPDQTSKNADEAGMPGWMRTELQDLGLL